MTFIKLIKAKKANPPVKRKTLSIAVIVVLLVVIIAFVIVVAKPRPVPIAEILKNQQMYKTKRVSVEGTLITVSTLRTKYGSVSFYTLKDKTGEIPVSINTSGDFSSGSTIQFTGTIGQVCTQGSADANNENVVCTKQEPGLIAQ